MLFTSIWLSLFARHRARQLSVPLLPSILPPMKLLKIFLTLALALPCLTPVLAAPGEVEAGYDPDSNQIVYSLMMQPDGKAVVGGL